MSDKATAHNDMANTRRSHYRPERNATINDGCGSGARDKLYEEYMNHAGSTRRRRAGWTVAIDLTATIDGADGSLAGANIKFERLRSLAAQTRNSPVEFVVQQARFRTPNESGNSRDDQSGSYLLERYRIRNGQIEALPSSRSQGMSTDLANLLQLATQQSSAARIGLIIQSHGEGPHGLYGDTGRLDLDELRRSVQAGLRGSEHCQLDLLDFDACNMSTAEVANSVRTISTAMIGAADPEKIIGEADGQNLVSIGREFTSHPSADGIAIARGAVRLASEGANNNTAANNSFGKSGTPDLEAIDLRNDPAINRSLDHLGAALLTSRLNNHNKTIIDELIRNTHKYETEGSASTGNQDEQMRDLPTFVEGLRDAIKRKLIADPSGQLRAASEEALKSLHATLIAHFSESRNGTDRSGGISVTLPELSVRDFRAQAASQTNVGTLDNLLHDPKITNFGDLAASEYGGALIKFTRGAAEAVRAQDGQTAVLLEQISRNLEDNPNQKKFDEQIRTLKILVEKIKKSPQFKAEVDARLRDLTNLERANHRHLAGIGQAPNWKRFIHALYG